VDADGIQVGVVSWGIPCAVPSYPDVYARVSDGLDWITTIACIISDTNPSLCTKPKKGVKGKKCKKGRST
jgi:secreted trypsin-like serine protease